MKVQKVIENTGLVLCSSKVGLIARVFFYLQSLTNEAADIYCNGSGRRRGVSFCFGLFGEKGGSRELVSRERERAQQTARRPGTGQYLADESLWLLEMGPLLLSCAKM